MKFLRQLIQTHQEWRRLETLDQATDEQLHEFLMQIDYPEFQEIRLYRERVKAILAARMDQRTKEAFEVIRQSHNLADKTYFVTRRQYQKTVWILWLTALAVFLALLALLK